MNDLEVRHCRVLLAVKDSGGIGAAARTLGVAQSTVSETLLALERIVGAPVTLRRPGHGAALTMLAETLVPHARMLVSASDAALAAVARHRQSALRLGVVESVSSFLLPGPLSAFRPLYPQIDVRIAIGLCEDLRERVVRAELDAALTLEGGAPQCPGCEVRALAQPQLSFVVAPHHALSGALVTRRDLATRRFLLADHQGAFNVLLTAWLGAGARLESAGSIDGVKRGVLNSDAIGVLPDYAVREELETRALAVLRLGEPAPAIALRLTTLKAPQPGAPLERLIAHIRAALPAPATN